jgi:hypothetical protein
LVPLTIKCFPSLDLTAVVDMLLTSLPASGSVIAIQTLFFPVSKSGKNFSCKAWLPNFNIGGIPNATPVVTAPEGPAEPVRASSST